MLVLLAGLVMLLTPLASGAAQAATPSAPTNLIVKSATFKSVTISWSAPQSPTRLRRYSVYKNGVRLTTTSALSYTVAGLQCGRSYNLGVATTPLLSGARSPVASMIASTSPCTDSQPPAAPTGVAQIAATTTSATVSWSRSADNFGLAGYGVYRNGVTVGMTAGRSYTFTGLLCGASYAAAVDAFDAAGNHSGQTPYVISASPCAPVSDKQPPSVPQAQRITGTGQTTIDMAWSASTDNLRVTGYELWLDDVKVGTTTGTTYTYTGLGCGTTHTVGLVAFDAAGNRSDRAAASGPASTSACPAPAPVPPTNPPAPAPVPPSNPPAPSDVQAPSTPTALAVVASTPTGITLSWRPSTDNVGVTGYVVSRGAPAGTTAGTSYTVTGLSCGTTYAFAVGALDAAGNNSPQAAMSAATSPCPDTQAPTQPANVTQTNRTEASLSIRWDAASDNTGVVGYTLLKAGAQVTTVTGTTYTFTGLACNTSYTLSVDAYDAAANHSTKAVVMMTTSPCIDAQAPSVPQGQQITGTTQTSIGMAWSASTDNVAVAGYEIWLDDAKVATTTSLTFTYAGLACATDHTVGLVAYDAAGNKSNRALASGPASTTACSTPVPPPAPTPPAPTPPAPTPPAPTPPPPAPTPPPPAPTPPPPAPSGSISPGQSWQTAYNAAPAGSTLTVVAGNHGAPTLTGTKAVTFLGQNGAVVSTMPGGASNVTFQNIDIDTGSTHGEYSAGAPAGANITWRSVDVRGTYASVQTLDSATNFRWLGGSFNAPGVRNCGSDNQPLWINADGATVDGVAFGVFDAGDCGASGPFHLEDIRIQGASDFTLLNSTFSAGSDAGSGTSSSPRPRPATRSRSASGSRTRSSRRSSAPTRSRFTRTSRAMTITPSATTASTRESSIPRRMRASSLVAIRARSMRRGRSPARDGVLSGGGSLLRSHPWRRSR